MIWWRNDNLAGHNIFYGVEIAIPIATIAQMMSNLSKAGMGIKMIQWKSVGLFLITAAPLTALGAFGFAMFSKKLLTIILGVFLVVFAIMKILGKMKLPQKKSTMLVGGGITGVIMVLSKDGGNYNDCRFFIFDYHFIIEFFEF